MGLRWQMLQPRPCSTHGRSIIRETARGHACPSPGALCTAPFHTATPKEAAAWHPVHLYATEQDEVSVQPLTSSTIVRTVTFSNLVFLNRGEASLLTNSVDVPSAETRTHGHTDTHTDTRTYGEEGTRTHAHTTAQTPNKQPQRKHTRAQTTQAHRKREKGAARQTRAGPQRRKVLLPVGVCWP